MKRSLHLLACACFATVWPLFAAAQTSPAIEVAPSVQVAIRQVRAEQFYNQQAVAYTQELQVLGAQLDAARQAKTAAQQKLDAHLAGRSWTDYLSGVIVDDTVAESLAHQVADADRRIALTQIRMGAAQQALDHTLGERAVLTRRLDLDAIKADPQQLKREEDARYDALVVAHQDFGTKRAQFRVGDAQFKAVLAHLDALIATFKATGQPASAAAFEKQKQEVSQVYDAWLAGTRTASANRAADIARLHAQNQADGIGPANNSQLLSQMTAYSNAGDSRAIVTLVDKAAVQRAAGSTGAIISGASISDAHAYTGWDFASDTAREYLNAYRDPKTFVIRYGYFWKGVGTAVKDGVTEIVVLAGKGADLAAESLEAALGIDTGLFGREESEALQAMLQGGAEMNADTLFRITDALISTAERRLEQHAGSGEKGIRAALSDTGYVVGTVAGAEELALKAAAYAGKLRQLAQALRASSKTDEAVQAAALAHVYEKTAEAARAGRAADAVGDVTPTTRFAEDALPPSGVASASGDATPGFPQPGQPGGQASAPGATSARGPPISGNLVKTPDGRTILRGTDGREYNVGDQLGAGGTSTAYAVPGERLIVKITDVKPENLNAARLDRFGYDAIEKIDPSMNARLVDQQVIDGKTVSVYERADPFSASRKAQADAAGVQPRDIDMTPGQIRAYREGMEKLNANGLAWFDNKHDNYAFVPIAGKTDEFRFVIIDPGALMPMKTADAARQVQRAIDLPDEALVTMPIRRELLITGLREEFQAAFSPLVDYDKLNTATGLDWTTIEGNLPFNPQNGLDNRALRTALRGDSSPLPSQAAAPAASVPRMPDAEWADYLRGLNDADAKQAAYLRAQGLTLAETRKALLPPPPSAFPDDNPFSDLPSQAAAPAGTSPRDPFRDAPTERFGINEVDTPTVTGPVTDADYAAYLRKQGLTETEIRKALLPPPPSAFPDDNPFSDWSTLADGTKLPAGEQGFIPVANGRVFVETDLSTEATILRQPGGEPSIELINGRLTVVPENGLAAAGISLGFLIGLPTGHLSVRGGAVEVAIDKDGATKVTALDGTIVWSDTSIAPPIAIPPGATAVILTGPDKQPFVNVIHAQSITGDALSGFAKGMVGVELIGAQVPLSTGGGVTPTPRATPVVGALPGRTPPPGAPSYDAAEFKRKEEAGDRIRLAKALSNIKLSNLTDLEKAALAFGEVLQNTPGSSITLQAEAAISKIADKITECQWASGGCTEELASGIASDICTQGGGTCTGEQLAEVLLEVTGCGLGSGVCTPQALLAFPTVVDVLAGRVKSPADPTPKSARDIVNDAVKSGLLSKSQAIFFAIVKGNERVSELEKAAWVFGEIFTDTPGSSITVPDNSPINLPASVIGSGDGTTTGTLTGVVPVVAPPVVVVTTPTTTPVVEVTTPTTTPVVVAPPVATDTTTPSIVGINAVQTGTHTRQQVAQSADQSASTRVGTGHVVTVFTDGTLDIRASTSPGAAQSTARIEEGATRTETGATFSQVSIVRISNPTGAFLGPNWPAGGPNNGGIIAFGRQATDVPTSGTLTLNLDRSLSPIISDGLTPPGVLTGQARIDFAGLKVAFSIFANMPVGANRPAEIFRIETPGGISNPAASTVTIRTVSGQPLLLGSGNYTTSPVTCPSGCSTAAGGNFYGSAATFASILTATQLPGGATLNTGAIFRRAP